MKYNDYKFMINEASATDSAYYKRIDFDEMVSLYKKHCTNNHIEIYRGTKSDHGKYNIIEGQKGGRKSENTSNHYTVFLDELIAEENKSYPLRSKSIIATTQISYAKKYGAVYNVIPFDDTWIGIVPSQDIWDIEVKLNNGKYLGIQQLNEVFMKAGVDDTDIYDVANQIENEIDDETYDKHLSKVFGERKDIEKKIREIYSLSKLGLKFVQAKDYKGSNGELWIGGKCLIIESETYDNIIHIINKAGSTDKFLYKLDSHSYDSWCDYYTLDGDDGQGDEIVTFDVDKYKLVELRMNKKVYIEDDEDDKFPKFFSYLDKHVTKGKESDYEDAKQLMVDESYKLADYIYSYLQMSEMDEVMACLDIDGFKVKEYDHSTEYDYLIYKK